MSLADLPKSTYEGGTAIVFYRKGEKKNILMMYIKLIYSVQTIQGYEWVFGQKHLMAILMQQLLWI